MKTYSKNTRKILTGLFLAPFLAIVFLVVTYKTVFIIENITSGKAYGFSINETYDTAYKKSQKLSGVTIKEQEATIHINYGGFWYANTLQLQFMSGVLIKIKRRRALFELP